MFLIFRLIKMVFLDIVVDYKMRSANLWSWKKKFSSQNGANDHQSRGEESFCM